jgi:hypothetical protein
MIAFGTSRDFIASRLGCDNVHHVAAGMTLVGTDQAATNIEAVN